MQWLVAGYLGVKPGRNRGRRPARAEASAGASGAEDNSDDAAFAKLMGALGGQVLELPD